MDELEQQRLWDWTLHEDLLFSERQNLFLVAESMLVAGHAAALDASAESAATAIGVVGLVLTCVWGIVSWRQGMLVEYIQSHARRQFREYRDICASRPPARIGFIPIRSRVVVTYIVPGLLAVLWIMLLASLA